MGKARDGKVSKDFGDGQTKITVRFNSERQARRVSFMLEYVRLCLQDGAKLEMVPGLLQDDLRKANEVLSKIEQRHSGVADGTGQNI